MQMMYDVATLTRHKYANGMALMGCLKDYFTTYQYFLQIDVRIPVQRK